MLTTAILDRELDNALEWLSEKQDEQGHVELNHKLTPELAAKWAALYVKQCAEEFGEACPVPIEEITACFISSNESVECECSHCSKL